MVESATSSPTPLEMGFWLQHRNRILGSLALVSVVVFGVLFWRYQRVDTEAEAWASLVEPGTTHLRTEVDLDAVRGTAAEPWALWWRARSVFDERDRTLERLESALEDAHRLRDAFPEHPLNRSGKVASLLSDLESEAKWLREHPFPTSNPPPPDQAWVTLRTSLGEIRIGLYPKRSPASVARFLALARAGQIEAGALAEAVSGQSVTLVPKEEESKKTEQKDDDNWIFGRSPDRNLLSHYKGAVSFQRILDSEAPDPKVPRVAFYVADTALKDDQEVVFGQVLSGLEILEQISTRSTEEGSARLSEPLEIEGVDVSPALSAGTSEAASEGNGDSTPEDG